MQTTIVMLESGDKKRSPIGIFHHTPLHKMQITMLIHAHSQITAPQPRKLLLYSLSPDGTCSSTTVLPAVSTPPPATEESFSNSSNGGNFFNEMSAVRERLTTSLPSSKLSSPLSSSKSLLSSTASSGAVALRRIAFSRSGNCGV